MNKFTHINILRAIAALLVVVYHVDVLGGLALRADHWWTLPMRYGWIGVDLFLVISGFVISLSAVHSEFNSPNKFRVDFLKRRFRRLVPLYVLTCLIYLFLVKPEILLSPLDNLLPIILAHALFLQNLSHKTHGVINGVTWSLALEMQFYFFLIFTINYWRRLGPVLSLLILITSAIFWRYLISFLLIPGTAEPHLQVIYSGQLPGTLDAFGVGVCLALMTSVGPDSKLPFALRTNYLNMFMWLLLSALILFPIAWILVHQSYWSNINMIVFWRTGLALGFGAALAAILTCPVPTWLVLRPLNYLGEISYGIYLWHFLVLTSLLNHTNLRGGILLGTVIFGTLLLSSLSWHLMEKPLSKLQR